MELCGLKSHTDEATCIASHNTHSSNILKDSVIRSFLLESEKVSYDDSSKGNKSPIAQRYLDKETYLHTIRYPNLVRKRESVNIIISLKAIEKAYIRTNDRL